MYACVATGQRNVRTTQKCQEGVDVQSKQVIHHDLLRKVQILENVNYIISDTSVPGGNNLSTYHTGPMGFEVMEQYRYEKSMANTGKLLCRREKASHFTEYRFEARQPLLKISFEFFWWAWRLNLAS
eukprot:758918-Hanusia_phi.AAC.1